MKFAFQVYIKILTVIRNDLKADYTEILKTILIQIRFILNNTFVFTRLIINLIKKKAFNIIPLNINKAIREFYNDYLLSIP